MEALRIWVFGGGSLGLLYAAKLSAAGCDVSLVTRTENQALAIRSHGIGLMNGLARNDERQVIRCPAVSMEELVGAKRKVDPKRHFDANRQTFMPPDWILLTVKQYGLSEQVLNALAAWMEEGAETRLLAMQNGIGHMEKLADRMAKQRLYAAVVSEGALRTSVKDVIHTGSGETKLGASFAVNYAGAHRDEKLKQLQNVLQYAGFRTVLSNQLNIDIWRKLMINSAINPLTAVLRIRNGELLEHSGLTEIMYTLCQEALAVAARVGIPLQLEDIWKQLLEVCRHTAANKSSMLQDLEAGRPTEIRWINGAIVELAEQHGVDVPTHHMLVRLVQAREEIR